MDGAIVLNGEATKIAWANVQLMPDPTILSSETGTRHRTAERVSKQTTALVIAISPAPRRRLPLRRGDEVHPPGHPRRARESQPGPGDAGEVPPAPRPGLGPADPARVRGRRRPPRRALGPAARRAGDADGGRGRALHRRARHRGPADRDAAGGDDGRRRRRQDGADPRLQRRRLRAEPDRGPAGAGPDAPPGRARLRSPRRAARLRPQGQHPGLPRRARAATACWAGSRASPSLSSRRSPTSWAGWRRSWRPPTPTSPPSTESGPTRAKDIREGLRRLQEVDLVDRYLQS